MMLVNVQVTITTHIQVNHAMLAYLLKHVVEESQTRLDITLTCTFKIHAHGNIRLMSGTGNLSSTLSCKENLRSSLPRRGIAGSNLEELTTEVLSQLGITLTIAYYV